MYFELGLLKRYLCTCTCAHTRIVSQVEGGWLVATGGGYNQVVLMTHSGDVVATLGHRGGGSDPGDFKDPTAMALVPGVGLAVRDSCRVQVLASPDAIAMATMGHVRVAWMGAVARAGRGPA